MENISTIFSEDDLKEIDRLVEKRLFSDREHLIKSGVRILLETSEDEIRRMEEAKAEVNGHLIIYVGDILFAGTPVKTSVNSKEYYKIPVNGKYEGRIYTYGHMFVDCKTLQIDASASDSPEQIHKTALQLTGGSENDIPLLSARTLV